MVDEDDRPSPRLIPVFDVDDQTPPTSMRPRELTPATAPTTIEQRYAQILTRLGNSQRTNDRIVQMLESYARDLQKRDREIENRFTEFGHEIGKLKSDITAVLWRMNGVSQKLFGLHLLIVEDNQQMIQMAARVFGAVGVTLIIARTAEEARLKMAHNEVHAALIDIFLPAQSGDFPDTSGLDFARELRADDPGLPIIVMSGYVRDDAKTVIDEIGADVLEKPFTVKQVEELLVKRWKTGLTEPAPPLPAHGSEPPEDLKLG